MKRTKSKTHTPSLLVDEHADAINACCARTADSIAELAMACSKANVELKLKPAKRQLIAKLPFGASVFSKYAQIGADTRLMDPTRRHLLPAKMSVNYEVGQLADDEFAAFEAEGHLKPSLRRADVIRWKGKRRGEPEGATPAPTGPKLPGRFYGALLPKRRLADTEMRGADAGLIALAERYEMEVVFPADRPGNGNYEKAVRLMRRNAKKVVVDHIKQLKKMPERKTLKPELRKYAGFLADEVKIEADADEDRILEVLTTLGREDKFEDIRKEAYDQYPVDGSSEGPEWMDAVANTSPPTAALAEDMEEVRQQWKDAQPKSAAERKKALAGVK